MGGPSWNSFDSSYFDNSGLYGGPPTTFPPSQPTLVYELIVVESIDQYGDTILEISDTSFFATTTVASGDSLPTASTTSDPNFLLNPAATPAPELNSGSSPSTSEASAPTNYGISNPDSSAPSSSSDQYGPGDQKGHGGGSIPIGAIVVVPLALLAAAVIGFVLWRRRKAAKGGIRSQEMKMRSPEEGLSRGPPGYSESTGGLLMTTPSAASALAGTRSNNARAPAGSRANRASQPVILGTNMDGAYFTGLDTSDAVSMASGAPHSDRSVDVNSLASDEPPPPYRPRSVPSISRGSSLRNPGTGLAVNTNVNPFADGDLGLQRRDHDNDDATPIAETTPMHNPFHDPEDDAVSALSTPVQSPRWRGRGDEDSRSMISEFSFEHEHR